MVESSEKLFHNSLRCSVVSSICEAFSSERFRILQFPGKNCCPCNLNILPKAGLSLKLGQFAQGRVLINFIDEDSVNRLWIAFSLLTQLYNENLCMFSILQLVLIAFDLLWASKKSCAFFSITDHYVTEDKSSPRSSLNAAILSFLSMRFVSKHLPLR